MALHGKIPEGRTNKSIICLSNYNKKTKHFCLYYGDWACQDKRGINNIENLVCWSCHYKTNKQKPINYLFSNSQTKEVLGTTDLGLVVTNSKPVVLRI